MPVYGLLLTFLHANSLSVVQLNHFTTQIHGMDRSVHEHSDFRLDVCCGLYLRVCEAMGTSYELDRLCTISSASIYHVHALRPSHAVALSLHLPRIGSPEPPPHSPVPPLARITIKLKSVYVGQWVMSSSDLPCRGYVVAKSSSKAQD